MYCINRNKRFSSPQSNPSKLTVLQQQFSPPPSKIEQIIKNNQTNSLMKSKSPNPVKVVQSIKESEKYQQPVMNQKKEEKNKESVMKTKRVSQKYFYARVQSCKQIDNEENEQDEPMNKPLNKFKKNQPDKVQENHKQLDYLMDLFIQSPKITSEKKKSEYFKTYALEYALGLFEPCLVPILEKQFSYLYTIPHQLDLPSNQFTHIELNYHKTRKFKLVVLDLDETLLHTELVETNKYDLKISFLIKQQKSVFYIKFRPHLLKFLNELKDLCNIVVFTASDRQYAEEILNQLDPNRKIFSGFLSREHIMFDHNQGYKDLRILNYDLKNVVIIDNQINMFRYQLTNGIPILSFFNYKKDKELLNLIQFLKEYILQAEDVRPVIKEYFKLEQLYQIYPIDSAIKQVYL